MALCTATQAGHYSSKCSIDAPLPCVSHTRALQKLLDTSHHFRYFRMVDLKRLRTQRIAQGCNVARRAGALRPHDGNPMSRDVDDEAEGVGIPKAQSIPILRPSYLADQISRQNWFNAGTCGLDVCLQCSELPIAIFVKLVRWHVRIEFRPGSTAEAR